MPRKVIGKGATALALAALATAGCGSDGGATATTPVDDAVSAETASDSATSDSGVIDAPRDSASDVADDGSSFPIYK